MSALSGVRERLRLTFGLALAREREKHAEQMHDLARKALAAQTRADQLQREVGVLSARLRETEQAPRVYPEQLATLQGLPTGGVVRDRFNKTWVKQPNGVFIFRGTDLRVLTAYTLASEHAPLQVIVSTSRSEEDR